MWRSLLQRGVVCYSVCCVLSAPQPWACRGAFMSLELQCGVVCCSMSQCVCTSRCVHVTCVAVRRSVLQYVTVCVPVKVHSGDTCHVCCRALQSVATCCRVSQSVAVCTSVLYIYTCAHRNSTSIHKYAHSNLRVYVCTLQHCAYVISNTSRV